MMAGPNSGIEDQLKKLLWSPNSEDDKGRQSDNQSRKKMEMLSNDKDQTKKNKEKARSVARNKSDDSQPSSSRPNLEPKEVEKLDAHSSHLTLKEDIGQPISRGNNEPVSVVQSKTDGSSSGNNEPKKGNTKRTKTPKKAKNQNNGTAESMSDGSDPNRATMKEQKGAAKSPGNLLLKVDPELTPEIKAVLEAEFVFPLKKKSPKFNLARYHCRLCDYHCDNVNISLRHVKDTRHKRLSLVKATDIMMKSLPNPTEVHCKIITSLITQNFEKLALTEEEISKRNQLVSRLNEVISAKIPGITLTVYGSTATRFGLKDSDLNIDLSSEKPAADLSEIFILLRQDKSGLFQQVRSDFSSKIPSILFKTSSLGNIQVQLGINSSQACQTTELLATYYEVDYRLAVLATTFRYWAKLVKIDEQECGTLPSYIFYLMTVYYLQQCSPPVLPVLHELKSPHKKDLGKSKQSQKEYFDEIGSLGEIWECKNTQQVGELWIDLLKFYAIDFNVANHIISVREKGPVNRTERKWVSKRIAIEDPYVRKRNVAKSVSHPHIYEYIDDRFRAAYLYFGNPQTKNGPLFTHADVDKLQKKLHENLKHKHELSQSTSTSQSTISTNSSRADNQKDTSVAIEEEAVGEEITDSDGTVEELEENVSNLVITDSEETDASQSASSGLTSKSDSKHSKNPNVGDSRQEDEKGDDISEPHHEGTKTDKNKKCTPPHSKCIGGIDGLYDESLLQGLREEDFIYKFDKDVLYDGKGPAVMCQICQKEGHLKMACPTEHFPPLDPLPPIAPEYDQLLSQMLWRVPGDFKPSHREFQRRKDVLQELEDYIREFYPDACLEAFGSSCNGFGFRDSDLDICLIFRDRNPEDIDFVKVIEDLARKLKKHKGLYNVIPITSAKVPIVKFRHRQAQLEGDISLYNTLGTHNTRMLLMYSQIDPRVEALGYIIKVFAKICDIGDASRGSLSSYAYIILVLYYLQQCNPPVIPVLQEMHDDSKPTVDVEGWNAWYFNDLKKLPQKWEGSNKNKESLATLWIGLLKFFAEGFNFKDYVVCIRQLKPLTRFEKLWNGKGLALEDPFNLNHNLGGGVSRKMGVFIRKTIRQGYVLHGTPLEAVPGQYRTLLDYLFDKDLLSQESPPNDRGCRICGKIGHFAKECPVVRYRKERQANERREKELMRQKMQRDEAVAQQAKQRVPYSSDVLVSSDMEFLMHRDVAENRRRNNSTDSNGIPIPGSGHQRYQRSYSHGTPPSGSPRVSPYVSPYPFFAAPNNLTSPTPGYGGNSPSRGNYTWQQEQMMQALQRPSPHGRHPPHPHPTYVYPSSPPFYQHVIPASPTQHQQHHGRREYQNGSPGQTGNHFIPQGAVQTSGLPSTPSSSKPKAAEHKPKERIVQSNPTEGNLEVTISNEKATFAGRSEKNKRRKGIQKMKKHSDHQNKSK